MIAARAPRSAIMAAGSAAAPDRIQPTASSRCSRIESSRLLCDPRWSTVELRLHLGITRPSAAEIRGRES